MEAQGFLYASLLSDVASSPLEPIPDIPPDDGRKEAQDFPSPIPTLNLVEAEVSNNCPVKSPPSQPEHKRWSEEDEDAADDHSTAHTFFSGRKRPRADAARQGSEILSPLVGDDQDRLLPTVFAKCQPPHLPPISPGGAFRAADALERGLPHFDRRFMIWARSCMWKHSAAERPGGVRFKVPKEEAYRVQLFKLLDNWLPSDWMVACEANADRGKADILLRNPSGALTVLELVAHATDQEVRSHFVRAQRYSDSLACAGGACVVNFTSRRGGHPWPEPSLCPDVTALHVSHDADWTAARLHLSELRFREVKLGC